MNEVFEQLQIEIGSCFAPLKLFETLVWLDSKCRKQHASMVCVHYAWCAVQMLRKSSPQMIVVRRSRMQHQCIATIYSYKIVVFTLYKWHYCFNISDQTFSLWSLKPWDPNDVDHDFFNHLGPILWIWSLSKFFYE